MRDIPIGFLMTLSENEKAMRVFAALPKEQREQIIAQARHASSREEMRSIVQQLG